MDTEEQDVHLDTKLSGSIPDTNLMAPVLTYPNFQELFVLETDVNIKGLGAVLSQRQSDGWMQPVAFVSCALSPSEENYSISEL